MEVDSKKIETQVTILYNVCQEKNGFFRVT